MGKRGSGEGSIFQRRSDGRWVAAITMPGGRRRNFYGRSQAEALAKKADATQQLSSGLPIPPERLTLGVWLERWVKDVAEPNVRPSTLRTYQDAIRLHIAPALGRRKIKDLQPAEIRLFEQGLVKKGLMPSTVGRIHTALRAALSAAERDGLLARNPAKLVSPPRGQRVERHPFSPAETRLFLERCKGERFGALYILCLTAGLREGEALAVHWSDVDMERGRVAVKYTLGRDGQLGEPKSAKSRRTLPLLPLAVEALKAHRTRQLEDRLLAGGLWQERDLVFATHTGTPLSARNLIRAFHQFLETEGFRHQRLHDLRHGCASLLAASGVPLRVVSEILGHSSYQLTANLYEHIYETVTEEATDQLGAFLAAN
jgi:integrase